MINSKTNMNTIRVLTALNKIPGVEVALRKGLICVSKDDFYVRCVVPSGTIKYPSYRRLWEENQCSVPIKAWHFVMRYAVSQALTEADNNAR
jgi:hypothetical protein